MSEAMLAILLDINWQNLQSPVLGERLSNLLWFAGIILASLLLKKPMTKAVSRLISVIANRFTDKSHSRTFRELVEKPISGLLQTLLFYIAVNQLDALLTRSVMRRSKYSKDIMGLKLGDLLDHLFMFLAIYYIILLVARIIDFAYLVQREKAFTDDNMERKQLLPIVKEIVKLLLWSIGIFWILGSVFHVNIPALITGLGIGGVAIALAAKESIENLFAAITILSDKPFQWGDTIKMGSIEGKVERIGFRSTRIRSGEGTIIIVPNRKLVSDNVENISQRQSRRVKLVLSVRYSISAADLQKAVAELKSMIEGYPKVAAPADITVDGFGENVFQVQVSYSMPEPITDREALDTKQEISMNAYGIISQYTVVERGAESEVPKDEPEEQEEEDGEKQDNSII